MTSQRSAMIKFQMWKYFLRMLSICFQPMLSEHQRDTLHALEPEIISEEKFHFTQTTLKFHYQSLGAKNECILALGATKFQI